jgi:very-short-patch-repair endonuclease
MPRKARPFDADDLCKRYALGEGAEPLAIEAGTSSQTLKKALTERGIAWRGRSEANKVRLERLGPEGRQRITKAAHDAVRGKKFSPELIRKMFIARAKVLQRGDSPAIGKLEKKLLRKLRREGFDPIPQQAVETYNLDFGMFPIAVEVYRSTGSPLSFIKGRQRAEKLAELGWTTVYVWLNRSDALSIRVMDQIVSLCKFLQGHHATLGKHWMIRGSGKFSEVRINPDYVPKKRTTVYFSEATTAYDSIAAKTT